MLKVCHYSKEKIFKVSCWLVLCIKILDMKVLFVSIGNQVDYQCDCLFHGLCSLSNIDVYILSDYKYMFHGNDKDYLSKQYGMGFTITNRIPVVKKHKHSLEEASQYISQKYYDFIVYGSIWRCDSLLDIVLQYYKKNSIAFIDGEDFDFGVRIQRRVKGLIKFPTFYSKWRDKAIMMANKGLYFKRELRDCDRCYFYPISFAFPEENIVNSISEKHQLQATIIPGKLDTYIYKNEMDYYKDYQVSEFGITVKKAGWDCMRHYEILGNGCIPYFPHILDSPKATMVNFPKVTINETNKLYETGSYSSQLYQYYAEMLLAYTRENLTTKKLAEYVLAFGE